MSEIDTPFYDYQSTYFSYMWGIVSWIVSTHYFSLQQNLQVWTDSFMLIDPYFIFHFLNEMISYLPESIDKLYSEILTWMFLFH